MECHHEKTAWLCWFQVLPRNQGEGEELTAKLKDKDNFKAKDKDRRARGSFPPVFFYHFKLLQLSLPTNRA